MTAPKVFRVDGPVRRTRASLAAVVCALLVVLALFAGPPVLRAVYGSTDSRLGIAQDRLLLGCLAVGLASIVLAIVAVVRDRGTSRVGAVLLLADLAVQIVFAVVGTASTVLEGNSVRAFDWGWAALSLVFVVLAAVFVFISPRPMGTRRR